MRELFSVVMLISGALFAGGVVPILWERAPAWRAADYSGFRMDFAHTIRRTDMLQPALVVVCLLSTVAFAISATGTVRALAVTAAFGFAAILIGSTAGLVPIQRRLSNPESNLSGAEVDRLRTQWLRGHLIRTVVALVAFGVLVIAAVR